MNLGGSLLRLDSFVTLDYTQTGVRLSVFPFALFRFGVRLFGVRRRGLWLFGVCGFVLRGPLFGDGLSLVGCLYCRLMNLQRSLLGLDSFLTLNHTQAGIRLGRFGFGLFGFVLAFRGDFFGLLRLLFGFGLVLCCSLRVLVLRVTRSLGSGDDAGRGGYRRQPLGKIPAPGFFLVF